MKKLIILSLFLLTSIFANTNNIIISENYIPQENCEIIKTIEVDDNKTSSKEEIYENLRIKANKLNANAVLNTTYHASIFTNYISGDAAICNIEQSPSLQSKVIHMQEENKFPKSMYKYPLLSELSSNIGLEVGFTSMFDGTIYGGFSYATKNDYELFTHLVYLQYNDAYGKKLKRDLGYTVGLRHYLFANTKYEKIRVSVNYGVQDFRYTNSTIAQKYGLNLGLGYVTSKDSGFSIDVFYKAMRSSSQRGLRDHFKLNIAYKF